MRFSDDGGLGDRLMADQRTLNFRRADAVSRHLDHIIRPPHEKEVAILILATHVSGRVTARDGIPIDFVPVRIFINGAHHGGPWFFNHRKAAGVGRQRVPLAVDHVGLDAEKRTRGRSGLLFGARKRADQDHTGFRLPPGIHNGQPATGHPMVPQPCLRVNRLTDGSEDPEAAEVIFVRPLFAVFHQQSNRRGRRIENVHSVPLDQVPPPSRRGIVRLAFHHQDSRAVEEGPIDDIAVSRHPARIGDTEVHILVLEIEYQFGREIRADHVAAMDVLHPFGRTGSTRGVEKIEGVFRIHDLRRAGGFFAFQPILPVNLLG